MRRAITIALAMLAASLAACVSTHQESAALRMPRPPAAPAGLAPYASANAEYPSVGGDILKGTAPQAMDLYQRNLGEAPTPQAAPAPR
ncbi:MAG: hypothetical protein ACHP84_10180 [Caulobacterales bacterium]